VTNDELRQDLERSRQELLDLSNRNRLISCPRTTRAGLEIVDEHTDQVFDLLYRNGRSMSFLPSETSGSDAESEAALDLGQPIELATDANRHTDARLQTAMGDKSLQRTLLRLYRDSRTLIEEQGVNTLYLALGFLYWKESPTVALERRAPLLLLPVELNRSSARERFTLKYSGEDLGANISLQQKLKIDFAVALPPFPEDDLDPQTYFKAVSRAVRGQEGWRIEPNEMQLGFFSFTKLLMYQDLDPVQWPDGNAPTDHPILRGLIAGEAPQADPTPVASDRLDEIVNAENMVTILDADGSQTEALLRARRAKVMVIQGPPGTGKSQTIANLIADCVMQEKSVLFVAEKTAALDVVKRRLDDAGLGPACLGLSRGAKKKAVLEELRRTLEQGQPKLLADRTQRLQELESKQRRLSEYARAVNEDIGESGVSPRIAYLHYRAAFQQLTGVPSLALQGAATWTASQFATFSQFAAELHARLSQSGPPTLNAFWGSRRTGWMPGDHEPLYDALKAVRQAVRRAQSSCDALSRALDLPAPGSVDELKRMMAALVALESAPDMKGCRSSTSVWLAAKHRCDRVLGLGDELIALRKASGQSLLPEAWGRDVLALRGEALSLGRTWYRFFSPRWRTVRAQIAALGAKPPADRDEMVAWCDAILAESRLRAELDGSRSEYLEFFDESADWVAVDWTLRRTQAAWTSDVHGRVAAGELPGWTLMVEPGRSRALLDGRTEAEAALESLSGALKALKALLALDPERIDLDVQGYEALVARFEHMSQNIAMLQPLAAFNRKAEEIRTAGLAGLADFVERSPNVLDVVAVLDRTRYDALARRAVAERPVLADFDRDSHEATAKRFRELDRLKLEIDRQRAALAHFARIPRGDGGRLGVLRSEMAKKAKHMPIRKLLAETGSVAQMIKPVFLMSPLSVAQFLAPGCVGFDLVVFDEASQVKVVDGYGAILRGDSLIVVGDSKQLPPTNFFESVQEENEEEHAAANIESLLKKVESQVREADRPMLRWHYRSRHESLIAFSNRHFYDNGLVAFPSPVTNAHVMGLSLRHVRKGVYRRGESRANNPIEAHQVVKTVMEHARRQLDKPTAERESLMVATFSMAQREAILDALEIARRQDPSCDEFLSGDQKEPFDVKNLESVQGDERDVVFISVGYGRDKDGRMSSNFGPVNSDGGDRRLNVLCSRAKIRCVVFSNILAADIAYSENPGVRALRDFLYFAEKGDFDRTLGGHGDPENVFELGVKAELERRGHLVDAQIGCVGYRIDLAVRDPQEPGRYVLGIECDGATYHSAKSARDRDRLRQEVLESRGWRMHRVWSTSWFQDPEKEIYRAVAAIEDATRNRAPVKAPPGPSSPEREPQPVADEREGTGATYQVAKISAPLGSSQLHEVATEKLATWLQEVVRVEGPVHFEVATRRVAEATGTQRRGRRIVEAFQKACRFAVSQGKLQKVDEILMLPCSTRAIVRDRSKLDPADRRIEYVPRQEIDLGIKEAALTAHGIAAEEIPQAVARLLGLGRTSEQIRAIVERRVSSLRERGQLTKRGDYLEWQEV
jgi:very-short-patch-repair endonuclease